MMPPAKRNSKRKLQISSDSDEDVKTPETEKRRHSSRIYNKQHKPDFRLPSREKIWNDIPSLKSGSKLKNLTPRKTVNNFTKVYNTYNYDDYEDTSDDEISSVETSDSDDQKKKQHRVKNFHKRVQVQSSSSEDDDLDKGGKVSVPDALTEKQGRKDAAKVTDEPGSELSCYEKNQLDPAKASDSETANHGDSDESEVLSPNKRRLCARNNSLLESDDESEVLSPSKRRLHARNNLLLESDEESEVLSPSKRGVRARNHSLLESDDESEVLSPSKRGVRARNNSLLESDDDSISKKENAGGSDNESSNNSQYSDDSDLPEENSKCRYANQKIKQTNLFQKFRDAQAKRKKSISNT